MDEMKRKYTLPLNLQLFAEGDPEPEPQDIDPPAKKVEMTQAELDALIIREKGRVKSKYADYDDVKARLAEFEKADEERKKADMSDRERLEAEKADALKRAEEAEGKAQSTLDAANQRVIKTEFKLLARSADFNIRPDALDAALKLADLSAVKVDDEGNVSGVKEALTALIEGSPYLVEVVAPTKPKTIGEPNNPSQQDEIKTLEQQLAEAEKKRDFAKVVEISNKIKAVTK